VPSRCERRHRAGYELGTAIATLWWHWGAWGCALEQCSHMRHGCCYRTSPMSVTTHSLSHLVACQAEARGGCGNSGGIKLPPRGRPTSSCRPAGVPGPQRLPAAEVRARNPGDGGLLQRPGGAQRALPRLGPLARQAERTGVLGGGSQPEVLKPARRLCGLPATELNPLNSSADGLLSWRATDTVNRMCKGRAQGRAFVSSEGRFAVGTELFETARVLPLYCSCCNTIRVETGSGCGTRRCY
jgi:hypothetical protein